MNVYYDVHYDVHYDCGQERVTVVEVAMEKEEKGEGGGIVAKALDGQRYPCPA